MSLMTILKIEGFFSLLICGEMLLQLIFHENMQCKGGFNVGLFHNNMVPSVALIIIDQSTLEMVSRVPVSSSVLEPRCFFTCSALCLRIKSITRRGGGRGGVSERILWL